MKIFTLIPARSGSKRVKDKNIKPLGGMPLMEWSINTALDCKEINEVFVSTDSFDYIKKAQMFGADTVMRPECLCTDDCGDREVIIHFLSKQPCDLVVYLRPTTPFRESGIISEAIKQFLASGNDSMRSIEEMSESAYKCFEISGKGLLCPIGEETIGMDITDWPNQKCPKTFHPNGYVDILKSSVVLAGGSIWGERKMGFITPKTIEIDTEDDFLRAEWHLQACQRP